jgi:hypothetical protein
MIDPSIIWFIKKKMIQKEIRGLFRPAQNAMNIIIKMVKMAGRVVHGVNKDLDISISCSIVRRELTG